MPNRFGLRQECVWGCVIASTTAAAQFDFASGKSATMHSKTSFKGSVVFTLRGGGAKNCGDQKVKVAGK